MEIGTFIKYLYFQEYNSRPVSEDSMTSVQAFKEMKEENEKLRQKVEKLEIELNTVTQGFEQENRLLTSASHQQVPQQIENRKENIVSGFESIYRRSDEHESTRWIRRAADSVGYTENEWSTSMEVIVFIIFKREI